ncbi:MAG: FAD-dependent oxidoreductase [Saprospiraceae bacterium]
MKTPLLSSLRQAFQLAQAAEPKNDRSVDDVLEQAQQRKLDRRQFLRTTAQAGAVLGLGGAAIGSDWLQLMGGKNAPRIAIVGAGMGGLSAGYYLRQKGVGATIFEADKRVGGRIKTGRMFGEGNLFTEIGAEFIDTVHEDMLRFVRLLNLETKLMDVDTDVFGERDAFFIEGNHHSLRDVVAELNADYPRIAKQQLQLEGRHAPEFDRFSMAEYIDSIRVSPWVKKLLTAAYLGENGMETDQQSAVNLLSILQTKAGQFTPFGESDERFKISGGNEQIPLGLANLLRSQIRLEHRLMALRELSNGGFQLTFSENGTTREETYDAVVLALPFTVLRQVDIKMELPPIKQQVIKELGYGTNAKFILETKGRPWRDTGYRGYLFNETIHNGWDSTQLQQGNQGVGTYTIFYGGEAGKKAVRGTEQAQLDHCLPELEGAFAGTRSSLTGKMELAPWPSNPFVGASYSCFSVGQVNAFTGAAGAPLRNLFFAGEHCSIDYWGFMNGGAETGRKTAKAVLKKMHVR